MFESESTCKHMGMPRRHRGDRDSLTVRPPADVGAELRARAREAGMSVTDYGTLVMAAFLGRDDLVPGWFPDGDPAQPEIEIRLTG